MPKATKLKQIEMRGLFFDTETTGLPKDRYKSASQGKDNWPDIVSLSWVVTEGSKIVKARSYILQPDGWTIPEDSIRIHGITMDMAKTHGQTLDHVLGDFIRDLRAVDVVIAHNLEFDSNVILAATLYRCKMDHALKWPSTQFCTMEASTNLCKLPLQRPSLSFKFKPPKLSELYSFLYKTNPPEDLLHTSLGDVMVLVAIFFKIWTLEQVASYARGAKQSQDSH